MRREDFAECVGLIRDLRVPPQEDVEQKILELLKYVSHRRVPRTFASDLAWAIAESGEFFPTKQFHPIASVHSTGAPGSLSTILSPILVAACEVYVPLVSVRGGVAGAIDSLATIPGYRTGLAPDAFVQILAEGYLVHAEHSQTIAPADRILWNLRDKSHTKKEPVLIAASLLGKKLAVGAVNGVIDVRVGPAGNAGSSMTEAIDTAYAIVGTAQDLGMRVTCILSDASRLGWHRVGRIDYALSVWDVLRSPEYWKHPHVQFCIRVAACACHTACPAVELDGWLERVVDGLTSKKALGVFEKSISLHGASADSLPRLRREADERLAIRVTCPGELDLEKVSPFFKALREEVGNKTADFIGLEYDEHNKAATIYLPKEFSGLEMYVKERAASMFHSRQESLSVRPSIMLYTGQVVSLSS
jgi:thymidine phosphorylase